MLSKVILYSLKHKLVIALGLVCMMGFGIYAMLHIPIGAVPDITNNQVQVITTSRNLATEDVEKFLTYSVELEMANLPGVKEIRSISKFGLSVVTIVFEENMGNYLPRQLIAEKIKTAQEKIPKGFGTPFMGPISTGLGEIYQYILDVKPEYRDRYSITDLRTIQDWIVKRQLSGIRGVVEVNTWGGYLKTYEVAVDPSRLRAMDISIAEIYTAMVRNNSIAGGGYIEKNNSSYFIRAEGLVTSLEDIRQIVIKNRHGVPIYIKDVAAVGFGHATRFGAITGNGEGEKVLGQIMMLKGANSKDVIERVKKKVITLEKTLPEGVFINPIIERSKLVFKTTNTVAENLLLGCLIVVFVVILLLGNLRSGLIVASVIPLALLFAISLMYLFDLDANLMSLGAIDFGIIIDGAVIIVEYIAFTISKEITAQHIQGTASYADLMDSITHQAASKMMRSAVFGQLIIIVVFIPILSLSGVEGKMFKPMAMTFSFALIGTMILCLTYVPIMCSVYIKPDAPQRTNLAQRMIQWMQRRYQPVLLAALRARKLTLLISLVLITLAIILFTRMGGEFIPTLDEGDFVIQPLLKTGMSLDKTIEMTTRMEKIIKRYPEVEQVVSRIGAAEVPTDPMSMEESDVIIALNDKKTWSNGQTKDNLADQLKKSIESEIPAVEVEFTQPIEMRFNELITGVRADLAIKIFGENLDVLYKKAMEVKAAIDQIPGASDIVVEKTEGLPQMTIVYDRKKIAQFGLDIENLNQIVSMGFAGLASGTIFEGERQFDLVIKYDEAHRKGLEDIKNALVTLPDGHQMPLSAFAEIRNTSGPAKISRDNTKRRIVVGVNVRGRDLQSVVTDVQKTIQDHVLLPPGYTLEYGGQFENLQSAMSRLKIAVPIALVLIFLLLFFAFDSFKEALIIFSAIPLSAVGGLLLLWIRGMPFSISAGVGFIALFGIAVLNGIVLIEYFKELKSHGMNDINQRVLEGTSNRLRPILLTATAAAFGFLPMALSTSVGAEVQRPLATVVIGGLISATLLTLIVLPVLYTLLEESKIKMNRPKTAFILLILIAPFFGYGQKKITLDEAIQLATNNSLIMKSSVLESQKLDALQGTYLDLPKTEFSWSFDRANLAENGTALHVLEISQNFKLPGVYQAQKQLGISKASIGQITTQLTKEKLKKEVTLVVQQIVFNKTLHKEYLYQDSLFERFIYAANRKQQLGESNQLETMTASLKSQSIRIKLNQISGQLKESIQYLKFWLNTSEDIEIADDTLIQLDLMPDILDHHSLLEYQKQLWSISEFEYKLTAKQKWPEFKIGLFNGFNLNKSSNWYPGFIAGIALPIWSQHYNSGIQAAKSEVLIKQNELELKKQTLQQLQARLKTELSIFQKDIERYQLSGKSLQFNLVQTAEKSFLHGEIDFFQYIQILENASELRINYVQSLFKYNMALIELNFLIPS